MLNAKGFLIYRTTCLLLRKFVTLMVLWGTSRESVLKDRLGYKAKSTLRLWSLMVEVVEVMVMERVVHRFGGVIIR